MSCCGQKRNALKRSPAGASVRPPVMPRQPPPASGRGTGNPSRSAQAIVAFLTRNDRR